MAKRVRIEINKQGVRDLLLSREVAADIDRRAGKVAAAAGPGFVVKSNNTSERHRAVVVTDTHEARRAEAKDRALTRAIDAGR